MIGNFKILKLERSIYKFKSRLCSTKMIVSEKEQYGIYEVVICQTQRCGYKYIGQS
jgi:hypothetical protein